VEQDVFSILSGGGFVALIGLVKWLVEKYLAGRDYDFRRGLERMTEVYNQLNLILVETSANRVGVFRAEDSGKVPSAGKDLFSSVIHEVYDEEMEPIYPKWRSQPVDAGYLKILLTVAQKTSLVLDTEEIESLPLRQLYEADGVARTFTYELFSIPTQYFYVVINFKTSKALNYDEMSLIAEAITKIRLVFLEQYKPNGKYRK
jgi:hypothetical protein